jgi:hypothetical protein
VARPEEQAFPQTLRVALLAVLVALCDVRRTRACAEEPTRLTPRPVQATDATAAFATLLEQALAAGWVTEKATGRHACPTCAAEYWNDWPAQLDDWQARQAEKQAQAEREAWERAHPPGQVGTDPNWRKPRYRRR